MNRTYTDDPEHDYGPSRSQQRRDALAVLAFATQLMELPISKIGRLNLPDDVLREIDNTRRITSHIARKRQLAFLAKVMRRHGDDAFADARAALGENKERQRQETAAMHRMEAMRDRLLGDDSDAAMGQLIDQHPGIDRQHLRSLIRQARSERDGNKPPRAYREIFQLLKELASADEDADDAGLTDGDDSAE
ncbi:ribosome biogenesis factor YjgA [Dyella sp.]|uniref:ribosome biogenesis factor YjgA n=1 Tax=Dyella sp. TaxID=1869338 RepID=UPI002ED489DC